MIGVIVGTYRITHELGSGGMGVVYAAEHVVLRSKAAVKVLQPRHSSDKEVVTRFFNEARAATRIRHPGIVSVFDFGNHESGSAYLVMELLEGETLAQRIKRGGKMPWRTALVMLRQTAGALEAAHQAGIVHRDLKPHNLFLVRDPDLPGGERVKVLDFGIAKLASGGGTAGDDTTGHTREGALLGTPKYMSPEQCRGAARVDARADVYSLGCVMFALICGEPPFSGEGSGEVMAKQIYEPPPRPVSRVPGLDAGVEELILRCLEKDPAARPASMHELGERIDVLLGREGKDVPALPGMGYSGAPVASQTMTATSTPVGLAALATPGPVAPDAASAPGHVTTLGASAAEISAGSAGKGSTLRLTGRSWRTMAAVAGLAVLGTVALVWTRGGLGGSAAPVVTNASFDAANVGPAPAPVPVISRPDAAAPAPAPGPTRVTLRISSEPPGAAVVRLADGEFIGQSPVTWHPLAADGVAEYAVRLRGYREQRVTLRTDADGEQRVVLQKDRSKGAAKATAGPPATTPAASTPVTTTPAKPVERPILDGTLDPFGDQAPDASR